MFSDSWRARCVGEGISAALLDFLMMRFYHIIYQDCSFLLHLPILQSHSCFHHLCSPNEDFGAVTFTKHTTISLNTKTIKLSLDADIKAQFKTKVSLPSSSARTDRLFNKLLCEVTNNMKHTWRPFCSTRQTLTLKTVNTGVKMA